MRMVIGAAAAVCALMGFTSTAAAQSASSLFTNVPPGSVVNKPIDTNNAIRPLAGQQSLLNRFNFSAMFRRDAVPNGRSTRGVSALPSPSSFPSTGYKNYQMVGQPPYLLSWMFGGGQQPLTPPLPKIPDPTASTVGPGS